LAPKLFATGQAINDLSATSITVDAHRDCVIKLGKRAMTEDLLTQTLTAASA
jgi:hypothetical protein